MCVKMSEIDGMNFGAAADESLLDISLLKEICLEGGRPGPNTVLALIRRIETLEAEAGVDPGFYQAVMLKRAEEAEARVRALEAQIGYEGGVILRLREKLAFARVGSSLSHE